MELPSGGVTYSNRIIKHQALGRGTVRGTSHRINPAQRVSSMRLSVPSVQLARTMHEAVLLVNGRSAVRSRSPAPRSEGHLASSLLGASSCEMTPTCSPTTRRTPGRGTRTGPRTRSLTPQLRPGWNSTSRAGALHRQPAPGRRLRPAKHRRPPRPQRRWRDHAAALRRPGPRGRQASRRIPRAADRQIYSVISSALT